MSMSHKDTKLNDLIKGTSGKARVINELKQALTKPKISDSEVEFKELEQKYIQLKNFHDTRSNWKPNDNKYKQLLEEFKRIGNILKELKAIGGNK